MTDSAFWAPMDARSEWRVDILLEHFEDLSSLFDLRSQLVRSHDVAAATVWRMDERIWAHADALHLAGRAGRRVMEDVMDPSDEHNVLAAAFVLALSRDEEDEERIFRMFESNPPLGRDAIRRALGHAGDGRMRARFAKALLADGSLGPSAAWLGWPDSAPACGEGLRMWMTAEAAVDRRVAWDLVALAAARPSGSGALEMPVWEAHFLAALADPEPTVREAALWAAVWRRELWLVPWCCAAIQGGKVGAKEAASLLALVGGPKHLAVLLDGRRSIGEEAFFDALAAHGDPIVVDEIIELMKGADTTTLALAGRAFRRLTGLSAETAERVPLFRPGETDPEFAQEIRGCDPVVAARLWQAERPRLMKARRLRSGVDVADLRGSEWPVALDPAARHEHLVRERFLGRWEGEPFAIERLTRG